MAETLQLKHTHIGHEQPEYKFYFYEGEADVHFGVIDLPLDPNFEHWALRAWLKGYRLDPETNEEITRDELLDRIHGTTNAAPAEAESTESAGDDVEGTDAGGLAPDADGVRESEPARDEGVSGEGLGSGVGDGSTGEGSGDESAD